MFLKEAHIVTHQADGSMIERSKNVELKRNWRRQVVGHIFGGCILLFISPFLFPPPSCGPTSLSPYPSLALHLPSCLLSIIRWVLSVAMMLFLTNGSEATELRNSAQKSLKPMGQNKPFP